MMQAKKKIKYYKYKMEKSDCYSFQNISTTTTTKKTKKQTKNKK